VVPLFPKLLCSVLLLLQERSALSSKTLCTRHSLSMTMTLECRVQSSSVSRSSSRQTPPTTTTKLHYDYYHYYNYKHYYYDKTLLVHIVDSYRTIKITVFRPAPNHTQQTVGASFKITSKNEVFCPEINHD